MKRLLGLLILSAAGVAGPALANDYATLYEPAQLDRTRERTVPGVLENFREVVLPALTADERAQLGSVECLGRVPSVGARPAATLAAFLRDIRSGSEVSWIQARY